ncbi:MAG: DUF839 domain-containing protein [Hyphomicrobiales bacterium]
MRRLWVTGIALLASAAPLQAEDFGALVELQLAARSAALFGIDGPLAASAAPVTGRTFRRPDQPAAAQALAARSLTVDYLTRDAADRSDQMVLYPPEAPTHLVGCVESARSEIGRNADGSPLFNPSVQRIALADGKVETVLRGLNACDMVRATAWGTLLVGEERDDGGAYEILDPLAATDIAVLDRETGATSAPEAVAKRTALPTIAWEGAAVLPSGVVMAGDESRPGEIGVDRDGGTIFKFVPSAPHPGGRIAALARSPLVDGRTYALQVSCYPDRIEFGQGCEVGNAGWIGVDPATARLDADGLGATGYYRPEDMDIDPRFEGPGVRFCWVNTGRPASGQLGEIMCAVDRSPMLAAEDAAAFTVLVERFVIGDEDFNAFDNLAFQPATGILYVSEDRPNGDVFACLPDGADRDAMSDGCIKVLSLADASAEPTGLVFAPDGLTLYLAVQHSDDSEMPERAGFATDDVLKVTGLRLPGGEAGQ